MRAMAAARRGGAPAGPALAWTLLGTMAGCGLNGDAAPAIARLMPMAGYSDTSVAASIYSDHDSFRPTYHIDARSGASTVDPGGFGATLTPSGNGGGTAFDLEGVVWQSLGLLAARIPQAIPPGWYDLTVRDPRGGKATAVQAFQSLGTDTQPPLVRIASPATNTQFAVGATVPIVIVADDGKWGTVTSLTVVMSSSSGAEQMYTCMVTGLSIVSCPFTLPAPLNAMLPDVLTITATATGSGGLTGVTRGTFPLVGAPYPGSSFYPNNGSTRGGTVVSITGENFAPDTSVAFDGIPATMVQVQSVSSLTAVTPMHPLPGMVHVTLTSSSVTVQLKGQFTYLGSPLVRAIQPASGPSAGGFPVTVVGDNFANPTTQIFFGTTPLRCQTFVSANRIDGLAPAGVGTQAVSAVDSVSGSIPNATVPFQYTPDDDVTGLPPDVLAFDTDAGVDAGDGGAVDAGADADAGAPEAGCPGGPL
jgi:hypothetical protein